MDEPIARRIDSNSNCDAACNDVNVNTDKALIPVANTEDPDIIASNITTTNALSINNNETKVTASFYQLYDYIRNIGGNRVDDFTSVPNGMEPHDSDPAPRQILNVGSSDIFIYNGASLKPREDKIDA